MSYSYFIKKNIDHIIANNYLIYDNGRQLSKVIKNFEVLITDYTGPKIIFERIVIVNVWIKQTSTDIVFFDRYYKGSIFRPGIKKMEQDIVKAIERFEEK